MAGQHRFVIVGSGNIAGTWLRCLAAVPGAEAVGVISRNPQRAAAFAREHGLDLHGCSLSELPVTGFDAVIAANPSGHHGAVAVAAASLGKHALLEKPLDISATGMEAAIAACASADVRLGVCYQRRLRPENLALKQLLAAGALGRVLAVDLRLKFHRGADYYASAGWRGTWAEDGGGPFMQQAAHDLDLLCWLFGRPERVLARTATLDHPDLEVEDHGAAILDLPGGAIATVIASTVTRPGSAPRWEVHTERGGFVTENDRIVAWDLPGVPVPMGSGGERHNAGTSAAVADTSAHEAILADFVAAIGTAREPAVSGRSARLATDTVLAIYAAARTSRSVPVAGGRAD